MQQVITLKIQYVYTNEVNWSQVVEFVPTRHTPAKPSIVKQQCFQVGIFSVTIRFVYNEDSPIANTIETSEEKLVRSEVIGFPKLPRARIGFQVTVKSFDVKTNKGFRFNKRQR